MVVPADVATYLHEITRRLEEVLAEDLLGVYAAGSVGLDAFDPISSDVDVIAVCAGAPERVRRRAVVEELRHERLACPARGLELVVYGEDFAGSGAPGPGFVLELNDGPAMPFRAHLDPDERPSDQGDFWYVIDRSITREHGQALWGPHPSSLLGAPGEASVHAALRSSLDWHARREATPSAVLNACRAMRWVRDRRWLSKPAAGRWWLEAHDEPVVRAALTGDPLPRERFEGFVRRAQVRLAQALPT